MKYVTYTFTFKNGIKDTCRIEIEPHEEKEVSRGIDNVNKVINNCLNQGISGSVRLSTVDGVVLIGMGEVQSVQIEGLEELVEYEES